MGKRAPLIIAAAVVVLLLVLTAGVYAYDSSRDDQIAKGVTVAGVDVGGMSKAQASRALQQQLAGKLEQPIVVRAVHRHFTLRTERSQVRIDVPAMVNAAIAASRQGNVISRTWRGLTGGEVHQAIALKLSYNDRAVRSLVRHIARRVNRAPVDATVTPTATGLATVKSQLGYALQGNDLRARLEHALVTPSARRHLVAHTRIVDPAVTTDKLAAKYPWYIVVNRPAFKLTVYQNLRPKKSYTVAVGRAGLETPAGLYHVEDKQVNPS
jgi:vancomycin resistance protein YoaR